MDKKHIKEELEALSDEGLNIYYACVMAHDDDFFEDHLGDAVFLARDAAEWYNTTDDPHEFYHPWYYKSCALIKIFLPEKLPEFEMFYTDYIRSWLINSETDDSKGRRFKKFESGFKTQRRILSAIATNADHFIFNLETNFQYGVYKSAMDIAKEIQEEDSRIAGAIASVMLEVHLKKIAIKHGIEDKENNSIADYNNFLKTKRVYDGILADQIKPCRKIRNKCIHTNQGDPSVGEVSTIIHIADRVIAEVN